MTQRKTIRWPLLSGQVAAQRLRLTNIDADTFAREFGARVRAIFEVLSDRPDIRHGELELMRYMLRHLTGFHAAKLIETVIACESEDGASEVLAVIRGGAVIAADNPAAKCTTRRPITLTMFRYGHAPSYWRRACDSDQPFDNDELGDGSTGRGGAA